MAQANTLSARQAAWKTLNAADIAHHDTADILSQYLDRTDRGGQATDIVMGVLRLRGTIDRILKRCASLDPARVTKAQWNLLQMGVYELVYCPKTAEYAILNETARLADKSGSKAVGFINAVLRNVQRDIESRQVALTAENITRTVPQDEHNGCLFRMDILPDFTSQPEQYLHLAYSMPQPLVKTWLQQYGLEAARQICIASNRNPGLTLQVNTLKTSADETAQKLRDESIEVLHVHETVLSVRGTGRLNRSPAYMDGLFFVQDPTAAMTAQLLAPEPGWTVLDLCSAPGGKAAAMAMRMRDQGLILASDMDADRLNRVHENARRLGLQCIEIVPAGQVEETARKQLRLDAIVLDVPCSNTGVLARRVEARWRWSQKEVEQLVQTQRQLLDWAADLSRPGTRILYSTCSIQPQENEQQVGWFLEKHRSFKLDKQQLTFPAIGTPDQFDHDGGFAAILRLD